jgi:hypothetical protein
MVEWGVDRHDEDATIPDLLTLLEAMATALRRPGPLDWATIAPIIGLRFDGVRAIGRSSAASAIEGGTLIKEGLSVDGVIFPAPRPQISLLFPDKTPSDPNFSARQFAADQHIAESRTGRGHAIVFSLGDVKCAILVTEPGAFITGLTVSFQGASGEARRSSIGDA